MRFKTARWKSSFIITPRALAKPGFIPMGKFSAHNGPTLDEPTERGERHAIAEVGIGDGVVTLWWGTEGPFDGRIVVEEGEENGDAFDDGGAQFGLDPFPIVVEPSLDGLQLFITVGVDLIEAGLAQTLAFNSGAFDECSQSGRFLGAEHVDGFVVLEAKRFQIGDMCPEIVRRDEQEVALFEAEFRVADLALQHVGANRAFVDIEQG